MEPEIKFNSEIIESLSLWKPVMRSYLKMNHFALLLLGESSFTMELFPEAGVVNRAGLWGHGNFQTLKPSINEYSPAWHGDMYTLILGTDYKVSKKYTHWVCLFTYRFTH